MSCQFAHSLLVLVKVVCVQVASCMEALVEEEVVMRFEVSDNAATAHEHPLWRICVSAL